MATLQSRKELLNNHGVSGVLEDRGEYVEFWDPITSGIIYGGTRAHFFDEQWLKERGLDTPDHLELLDVIQTAPFREYRKDAIAFVRDEELLSKNHIEQHMKMLVDYVCHM